MNGRSYKILDGFHYISRGFLLREEVEVRKVYLTLSDFRNQEYLLYDFSMNVGDSIDMKNPITPFPEDAGFYKLDSIVPRTVDNNQVYRFFYLSPTASNTVSTHNAVWIEGLGSLSIITAPGGDPDINGVGQLSCAFKNGNLIYSDYDIVDDCIPRTLDTRTNQFSKIKLIQESRDYVLTNTESVQFYRIYDLQGRVITGKEVRKQPQIPFNLSSQSSGIYLIQIRLNTGQTKIFKINK